MLSGVVHAVSISPERGQLKKEIPEAELIENFGIKNDGHAGNWGRHVNCLSWSSVKRVNKENNLKAGPGDFAENILIDGMDLSLVTIGDRLKLGRSAILEVTQIGKEDHPSVVSKKFGVSLLPFQGLFCGVINGGRIKKGDSVKKI